MLPSRPLLVDLTNISHPLAAGGKLRFHNLRGVFSTQEKGCVIQRSDKFKIIFSQLFQRAGAHSPGVADKQVEPAKMFNCFRIRPATLCSSQTLTPIHGAAAEVIGDFLRKRLVQVGDDDHGALPIQCFGKPKP